MNWLSLGNNWLKYKTSGKLQIVLEESMECTSNYLKKLEHGRVKRAQIHVGLLDVGFSFLSFL